MVIENLKGGGGEGSNEAKLEFLEEWGTLTLKTIHGEVWIFSGPTHYGLIKRAC